MPRNNETAIDDVYDAILARATVHPLLKGVAILDEPDYDGEMSVGTYDDGTIKPYVVITFGDRGNVASAQKGIVGARADHNILYWGATVYAATSPAKRRIAGDVRDIFIGWEPPNSGEIDSPYSGAVENPIENVRNSQRNGIGLLFRCAVNLVMPSDVTGGAIA